MTATAEIPDLEESHPASRKSDNVDAIGTRLRLRAIGAMGHSEARIARALGQPGWFISRVMAGVTRTVPPELRADALALYDAWWDKRPPEITVAERRAAAAARTRAQRGCWCPPMGLDDDDLDTPGYRPRCAYRPAEGSGIADDDPLGRQRPPAHRMEAAR